MRNSFSLKFLIISLLMAVMVSCSDRPSYVLSEDKMVDLMADMELTEAYSNLQGNNSREKLDFGKSILKAHGVSEETLDSTLSWYGRNMDEYSELFEKVDKEIKKREKKYLDSYDEKNESTENLWVLGDHLILSSLSGMNSFSFTIDNPDLKEGDILEFTFALANAASLKGTLAVEYTDGYGEGVVSNISSKKNIKISLTTDTAKKVERIFGTINLKDTKSLPLYIDSLKLIVEPFDSISYRTSKRTQKRFGPQKIKSPETKIKTEKKDTIVNGSDSLDNIKEIAIVKDSLAGTIDKRETSVNIKEIQEKNREKRLKQASLENNMERFQPLKSR